MYFGDGMSRKASAHDKSEEPLLGVLVIGEDGRFRSTHRVPLSIRLLVRERLAFLWRRPKVRESLQEVRKRYRRILVLWTQGQETVLRMGLLYRKSCPEGLRLNTTRLGRIQGREKLLSVRPWVSLQDQQFFLCGSELGREWALLHLGENGEETIGYSHSSEQLLN